ncbi:MAG: MBL fold metallo-hydrolase [Clostridia bacterium]|nr:MBL fold metallo-hydrolase [Clostridia bacterium]
MLHRKHLSVGDLSTSCYIVWDDASDECVVIDPGAEPERIAKACEGRRIAAILLTHGHFDHIGGVSGLAGADTEIVIHEADAPMLRDATLNASWLVGDHVIAPEATRTVREGDVLHYAGVEFTVLHTPGHTPGCVCYRAGEWLFTGDTLFHYGYGRTDLPGGSMAQLAASLRRLSPLAQKYDIFPGH